MIYTRIKESAVDGAIQTPDDIGVDLDQVEKDIAGENGIAAHQDEVEDAQEGMIGEPVEEFAEIVYESEYNFNQIMQAIGVAELNEAAMGRDMIYEAMTIKSLFEEVKKFIVTNFAKLTKAFKELLAKLDFAAKIDKKFVAKHENAIKEGFNTDWSKEGIDFSKANLEYPTTPVGTYEEITKHLDDAKNAKIDKDQLAALAGTYKADAQAKAMYKYFGADSADNNESFKKQLREDKIGVKAEKVALKGVVKVDDVINTLKGDRETAAIRKAYNTLKGEYKKQLATIKDWEKKGVEGENSAAYMNVCQMGTTAIKTAINVSHVACGVYLSVAKAKRSQYRMLAHFWAGKGKKDDKKKETAVGESTLFNGISML